MAELSGPQSTGERVFLGLRGLYSAVGDHIGHFYLERAERTELLVPFLKAGLDEGDKCVLLVSPDPGWLDVREALEGLGSDVKAALESGQLVVDSGKETLNDQREALAEAISDTRRQFHLLRWVGDVTWTLGRMPTTEELMKWETACNVIDNPPGVFLCQYDLKAFPGNVVFDALKTHPLCIIRDTVHRNPFYEDPGQYLEELQRRGGSPPEAV